VTPRVSVVVPVRDGERLIGDCLRALAAQTTPRAELEVIVVDDGSRDGSATVAEHFAAQLELVLLRQPPRGAAAARNAGLATARAEWVAFTDADCLPSRGWVAALLGAATVPDATRALGAAGRTLGHESASAAARFVDLTGGLDAGRHLSHPRFPFAPSANVMYRRDAMLEVGGFDARYAAYDGCDLHTRLLRRNAGSFRYEPRALVLHRHRPTWAAYWRQQRLYGRGYGQFFLHHRDELPWSFGHELGAWWNAVGLALRALGAREDDDRALVARGNAVKALAQRIGFVTSYWNPRERSRW
jgi:glycosyltransferase involved in cell wall biosynthesis